MSDRTRKLVSIRHRTDHDLLILVQRELDRGITLVAVATTSTSPLYAQAQKVLNTATALLPRIAGMSAVDRLRIEGKAAELRSRLTQVPVYANVCPFPVSVAS
jgi:hypothetical protein